MLSSTQILNARLPGLPGMHQLLLEGDDRAPLHQATIIDIAPQGTLPRIDRHIDFQGDWCSLGGVDLQINGALGLAFPDLHLDSQSGHLDRLSEICDFLWHQGVDGFLPTLVTTSIENFHQALGAIAAHMDRQPTATAQVLGVHLEGPCLNPEKRGAHPAAHLLPLTLRNIQQVMGDYEQIVKVITLAPELDSSGVLVEWLQQHGIIVSLGHSQATHNQAMQAFSRGATMVTHAFNAMPALHHRQPGLLAAALTYPGVRVGFIADGQHVHPTMLELLLRMAKVDRHAFLVSDALAPLGLPDGCYPWDSRQIEVRQGTARLPDGTLSGTTLPLLQGVDNLVQWGICSLEQGILLATQAPREAIGLPTTYRDRPAQLLRWHYDEKSDRVRRSRLTEADLATKAVES
jgi:N-acetylglucosamine-6-phosphate deacetylase